MNGLNDAEEFGSGAAFVRLQPSDHVKDGAGKRRQLGSLALKFLNVALAEMPLTGVVGGDDVPGGFHFRDGENRDFIGIAPGVASRRGHSLSNSRQSFFDQVPILAPLRFGVGMSDEEMVVVEEKEPVAVHRATTISVGVGRGRLIPLT